MEKTGAEITNSYESSGEVEIVLTVTDQDGLTDQTKRTIQIAESTTAEKDTGTNQETSEETGTDGFGPGFGVASGGAGSAGAVHLLKNRFNEED